MKCSLGRQYATAGVLSTMTTCACSCFHVLTVCSPRSYSDQVFYATACFSRYSTMYTKCIAVQVSTCFSPVGPTCKVYRRRGGRERGREGYLGMLRHDMRPDKSRENNAGGGQDTCRKERQEHGECNRIMSPVSALCKLLMWLRLRKRLMQSTLEDALCRAGN